MLTIINFQLSLLKNKGLEAAPQGLGETVVDDVFYKPAEESLVKVPSGAGAEKQFSYKDLLNTIWFCSVFIPLICQKH